MTTTKTPNLVHMSLIWVWFSLLYYRLYRLKFSWIISILFISIFVYNLSHRAQLIEEIACLVFLKTQKLANYSIHYIFIRRSRTIIYNKACTRHFLILGLWPGNAGVPRPPIPKSFWLNFSCKHFLVLPKILNHNPLHFKRILTGIQILIQQVLFKLTKKHCNKYQILLNINKLFFNSSKQG